MARKNANLEDLYPLSPVQQGMLFHTLFAPDSGVYVDQIVCELRGTFQPTALLLACQRILARHPALRTAFVWEGREKPLQAVFHQAAIPFEERDLSSLTPEDRQEHLQSLLREDRRRSFDLSRVPLLRLTRLRLSEELSLLLFSYHHILMDAWSLEIVLRELLALYQALATGGDLALEPARPYRDFIRWLGQQDLGAAELFWRRQLAGFSVPTPLPLDRAPRLQETAAHPQADLEARLAAALTEDLRVVAAQHELTLSNLVQGAWALLLGRYSGERDVVFGCTISGRPAVLSGVERMIGLFINTLPLRALLTGERPFFWLKGLQVQQLEMIEYGYSPLVEVQSWSDVPRGLPLFESILVFENVPVGKLLQEPRGARLAMTVVSYQPKTHYPLTLLVRPGSELSVRVLYDVLRFEPATIARMVTHFESLLRALVSPADQPLLELPLLSSAERHQLLTEWNDTATAFPSGTCLQELIAEQARRTPDAIAAVFGEERLTCHELGRQANRLAARLRQLGVGPEVRVGLCLERSLEMLIGVLGVLESGGAYVPLDPAYPRERLAFMMEDAGLRVLVTQETLRPELPGAGLETVLLPLGDETAAPEPPPSGLRPLPDHLAYVLYTSGSTGRPKGVEIPHRGLVNFLISMSVSPGLGEGDVLLAITSLSFDIAALEIFLPLLTGARLVIARREEVADGARLAARIAASGATVLQATPSTWAHLLQAGWQPAPGMRLLSGGEALSGELAQQLVLGDQLWNLYGPTETTVWSTIHRDEPGPGPVALGRPIANTALYLLDRSLQPVPLGVPGELCIGGAGVARGYHGRPGLTAERFVPDPFSGRPGGRLYRTGDLMRLLPQGQLEFLGRIDHQVKVRGFRIELGEIEATLERHPAVTRAVALVREDEPGERRVVAYVTTAAHRLPAELARDLRQWIAGEMPGFMIPSALMVLEEMPLTPNGKIDRRALPRPEGRAAAAGVTSALPKTPWQEVLLDLWRQVLGLDSAGIHDNFFERGGHSLLAGRLLSRLRRDFRVDLPLRSLFDTPTVAGLALAVEAALRRGTVPQPPIERVPRDRDLPLSFAQQRLWFLDLLEPGSSAYNIPAALRLFGALNPELLARSLEEIVRRHESLHTAFPTLDGQPVQRIVPPEPVSLPVLDLALLPAELRETELTRRIAAEAARPFDLARGPLFRATLLRLAEDEHVLMLVVHHIAADAWSIGVFVGELSVVYSSLARGESPSLPCLPVQPADHAVWQRSWLQGEALDRLVEAWRARLAGASTVLDLPTDRPRPALQTLRGAVLPAEVGPRTTRELRALASGQGATLFMVLLAAFATLLHRLSGQEDLIVGSPIAGRNRAEIEGLIGVFINTLALRGDLTGRPSFLEVVARARETALEAYALQDLPFEKLVEELQPQRDLARSPLFQAMLILQNAPVSALTLPGLELRPLPLASSTSRFDLLVSLAETGNRIDGRLEINTDLFDRTTALRWLRHLEVLIEGALAEPGRPVAELPMLSEAERAQLVEEWNDTASAAAEETLPRLFAVRAARSPEAPAVCFGDRCLSYGELNRRSNRLARRLCSLGVGPEVIVGLAMERSIELLVAVLGVLKSGGAYLPLDPFYPADRLAYLMSDSGLQHLLTQTELAASLPAHAATVLCLDEDWGLQEEESGDDLDSGPEPDSRAYVLYTSGSTGTPKGVEVPHRALTNFLVSMRREPGLREEARLLAVTSLSFDIAALELFLPLLVGGCVELASRAEVNDGGRLALRLADPSIQAMQATPASWRMLLDAGWNGGSDFTALCGGEALPPDLAAAIRERAGALWNLYGPTETTVWSAALRVGEGAVSLGRPIDNTWIHLLDLGPQPVPLGVPGEICIGGAGLARGYLGRPELTAERFVPDPFCSLGVGSRLYRTGDLGRRRVDGTIEFLGRLDFQVKVRGFRIEPGEIEAALASLPQVREAAVLAHGDGDERCLVAYVVPAGERPILAGALREALGERLPAHLVPSAFVLLDRLPLTPNGKVDRNALAHRAPAREVGTGSGALVSFDKPAEEIMAGIWSELLGVQNIGPDDDFFALGGHSLTAPRVASRIQRAFGVSVPVRWLFERPRIRGLAALVREAQAGPGSATPPIVPVSREGPLPLSFAQQRLWIACQLQPESGAYNIPAVFRLAGPLDIATLARVLGEISRRHEVLRTRFESDGADPYQMIAPVSSWSLPLVDLSALPPAWRDRVAEGIVQEEVWRPFDLRRGALLRATLLRLEGDQHLMLSAVHHIASDAWSMQILAREVTALYRALTAGQPSPLPELPIQYADYAWWQRRWLQGEALEGLLGYWRRRLDGELPVLRLPFAQPRPERPSYRGGRLPVGVPLERAAALKELGQRRGCTLFMVLLAALYVLLHRVSGQEDLIVGTEVANRNETELEPLIGFFINMLALRADLSGNPTFLELLDQVRELSLEGYAHQELPFDKLVEELEPERFGPQTSLLQTVFVLLNVETQALELGDVELAPVAFADDSSKFDLLLLLYETPGGLAGTWTYSLDLFAGPDIESLSLGFTALLGSIVEQPEARLDKLEMRTASEKEKHAMERKEKQIERRRGLADFKPRAVTVSRRALIQTRYLTPDGELPLVVEPAVPGLDLVDWARDNAAFVEPELLRHGAVLFRCDIRSAAEFERFCQVFCPELYDEYGDLPREKIGDRIYESTPYAADQAILFHNESSQMHCWPLKQWFFCVQPAARRGETPIADGRRIYALLDPALREELARKGLLYVRNFKPDLDVPWQEFFRTADQSQVEGFCRSSGITCEWTPDGGLRTRIRCPAVARHPKTGEITFFNQIQAHHISCLEPAVRASLLSLFAMEDLPRNVYYGDGSPIPDAAVEEVRRLYDEVAVSFPWHRGDILMVDNMLVAHSRNPYEGPRKILVAMGEMVASQDVELEWTSAGSVQ